MFATVRFYLFDAICVFINLFVCVPQFLFIFVSVAVSFCSCPFLLICLFISLLTFLTYLLLLLYLRLFVLVSVRLSLLAYATVCPSFSISLLPCECSSVSLPLSSCLASLFECSLLSRDVTVTQESDQPCTSHAVSRGKPGVREGASARVKI